jgi:hypothetical protein
MAEAQVGARRFGRKSVQAGLLKPNEPNGGSDEIEVGDVGCIGNIVQIMENRQLSAGFLSRLSAAQGRARTQAGERFGLSGYPRFLPSAPP